MKKKLEQKRRRNEKSSTFAAAKKVDLVAQQVEHHTFNVGVLGSSPSQVTKLQNPYLKISQLGIFLFQFPVKFPQY